MKDPAIRAFVKLDIPPFGPSPPPPLNRFPPGGPRPPPVVRVRGGGWGVKRQGCHILGRLAQCRRRTRIGEQAGGTESTSPGRLNERSVPTIPSPVTSVVHVPEVRGASYGSLGPSSQPEDHSPDRCGGIGLCRRVAAAATDRSQTCARTTGTLKTSSTSSQPGREVRKIALRWVSPAMDAGIGGEDACAGG